ncbi:MAG: hypothetical protein FJ147_05100 [Deltaproteobacteria bacterium]|nr:hypothetical protein [Deltaproteobacteria bacterium]
MKSFSLLLFPLYLLMSLSVAFAYEVTSHRLMSEKAVKLSIIGQDATLRQALGLQPELNLDDRKQNQKFPNYRGDCHIPKDCTDIIGLVGDGSVFEDEGTRALGHFYSPVTGEAISPAGFPSPDWALEDHGPRTILGFWEQNDSYADTRDFFLKALTQSDKDARERMWGRTFQGLGQVIHHLQDMAQPQHSRLDNHLKISPHGNFPFEYPSLYERLTQSVNIDVIVGDEYPPVFGAEDPTTFVTPRRFWDTDNGLGIAEYANRGFVTAGTNFDRVPTNALPSPSLVGASSAEENKNDECTTIKTAYDIELPKGTDGQPLPCVMTFLQTWVEDWYRPELSRFNPKTSTYSIFNADLDAYNAELTYRDPNSGQLITTRQLYTLNRDNYDEARTFLIPRAVGYSAGLINYFFRGKIHMAQDPFNPSQYRIENQGADLLKGVFTVYYDDTEGRRHAAAPLPAPQTGPGLVQRRLTLPVESGPAFLPLA